MILNEPILSMQIALVQLSPIAIQVAIDLWDLKFIGIHHKFFFFFPFVRKKKRKFVFEQ